MHDQREAIIEKGAALSRIEELIIEYAQKINTNKTYKTIEVEPVYSDITQSDQKKEGIKIKTSYSESPQKDIEAIVRFSKYINVEKEEDS